jgi:hypothetical protein
MISLYLSTRILQRRDPGLGHCDETAQSCVDTVPRQLWQRGIRGNPPRRVACPPKTLAASLHLRLRKILRRHHLNNLVRVRSDPWKRWRVANEQPLEYRRTRKNNQETSRQDRQRLLTKWSSKICSATRPIQ